MLNHKRKRHKFNFIVFKRRINLSNLRTSFLKVNAWSVKNSKIGKINNNSEKNLCDFIKIVYKYL